MTPEEQKEYTDTYVDFMAWAITESIFWLTPYILIFVILGFIFS